MADLRFVGILGAFGVLLGAFGAHVLDGRVTPERLQTWETAARYHQVMAVALLVLVSLPQVPRRSVQAIAAGTLVFAGSLYLLVLLEKLHIIWGVRRPRRSDQPSGSEQSAPDDPEMIAV